MAWSKLEDSHWTDRGLKALGRRARDLYAYLLTSPHRNRLGYYVADPLYAASDLSTRDEPWSPGDVTVELDRLHGAGRIAWHPATGVVLVRAWFDTNTLENGNVVKAALKDLRAAPDTPYLLELLQRLEAHKLEHLAGNPNPRDMARFDPLLDALAERVRKLALAPDLFVGPQLVPDPVPTPDGGNVDNHQEPSAPADPNGSEDPSANPSANGPLYGSGNGIGVGLEYLAVAVAVAVPEPSLARPSAEQEKPAIRDSARDPDPPGAELPTDPLERLVALYPVAAGVLSALEHPGGKASTAATLRHRFLYDSGQETLSDGSVRGLPLDSRLVIVAGALLEYADQGEAVWSRPLFGGYCRRIRERNDRDLATNPARAPGSPVRVFDSKGREVDARTGTLGTTAPPDEQPVPWTPERQAEFHQLVDEALGGDGWRTGKTPPRGPEKTPEELNERRRQLQAQLEEARNRGG